MGYWWYINHCCDYMSVQVPLCPISLNDCNLSSPVAVVPWGEEGPGRLSACWHAETCHGPGAPLAHRSSSCPITLLEDLNLLPAPPLSQKVWVFLPPYHYQNALSFSPPHHSWKPWEAAESRRQKGHRLWGDREVGVSEAPLWS